MGGSVGLDLAFGAEFPFLPLRPAAATAGSAEYPGSSQSSGMHTRRLYLHVLVSSNPMMRVVKGTTRILATKTCVCVCVCSESGWITFGYNI